ncbi:MAG: hypothetical protein AB7D38_06390 [Sulfurimonas sp.]|uniref:hypothetical protein n=1 Tax=Sulfurimonas sp. TaxID=2022749 RepID=UPI000CCF4E3F|nr:MAG: hypothetical protein C0627_09060 [Sulfurimonas sp.]
MAKRCEQEFNPWPAFVDVFSSVILVMLLFLLITIVNIVYYAQFKFKVSYTGAITKNEVISSAETKKFEVFEKKENIQEAIKEEEISQIVKQQEIKKTQIEEKSAEIERAGKDLSRIYEDEATKQKTVITEDYLLLNFGSNAIKLDNPTILQVREFINKIKQKNLKHVVKISAVDPTNQISATVMKQISLARTLNARNLIRQMGYDIKDVRIDLLNPNATNILNQNENGYLIIRIEKK